MMKKDIFAVFAIFALIVGSGFVSNNKTEKVYYMEVVYTNSTEFKESNLFDNDVKFPVVIYSGRLGYIKRYIIPKKADETIDPLERAKNKKIALEKLEKFVYSNWSMTKEADEIFYEYKKLIENQ